MAKVIKNVTIGWSWQGDTYLLKGFNIMITPSTSKPTDANPNAVAVATVPSNATSYIFANVVLDNNTTYTSWIQALYEGKDSDWINNNNVTVTDDGNATIETTNNSQTKANTAESNAKGYADNYALIDNIALGGVFTGSFELNKLSDGTINVGEVKVNAGKFIHPNGLEYDITTATINTMVESLSSPDWRYIAFIGSDSSRFSGLGSTQFMAIKFVSGQWKYDNNSSLLNFTPNDNDCIVAKVVGQTQLDYIQLYANKNVIGGSEADNFRTNMTNITSDNILSPTEKRITKKEFDNIVAEKPQIEAQATALGITDSDNSNTLLNLKNSYTTLYNYMNPLLTDLNTASNITGATMRTNFADYYSKRAIMIKYINDRQKGYTDSSISNIKIGGRNLLLKSGNYTDVGNWVSNGGGATVALDTVNKYLGQNTLQIVGSNGIYNSIWTALKPNTEYIYSITATASSQITGSSSIPLHMWLSDDMTSEHLETVLDYDTTIPTGSWKRCYVHFKTPNVASTYYIRPFVYNIGTATVNVANFKIEEGNKISDWTPASEDYDTSIGFINSQLSDMSSDNKVTPLEKVQIDREWNNILSEYQEIIDQGNTYFSVKPTEQSTFETKYTALNNYLNTNTTGNSGALMNLTTTTDLTANSAGGGATLKTRFGEYYDSKSNLLKKIALQSKTLSDTAQSQLDDFKLGSTVNVIDNTRDTLFHFDNGLCSTNGINPSGSYTATLRPIEGKFNGCIAVEEGTTNLFTNPKLETTTGWSGSNGSTLSVQSTSPSGSFPDGVNACVKNTIITGQTNGFTVQTLNLSLSTQYTYSTWVYIPSGITGGASLQVWYNNSGWTSVATSSITERDKWVYKTITFTSNATYASHVIGVGLNAVAGNVSYACKGQLEQKAFATSFVNGTRGAGNLYYDKSIFPTTSFTVMGWYKPLRVHQSQTGNVGIDGNWYYPLFELAPTTNRGTSSYGFGLAVEPNTGGNFRKIKLMSPVVTLGTSLINDNTWYFIAVTFDGSNYKVYVNGTLDITFASTTIPQIATDTVVMIGGGYCGKPNLLTDELLISSKVFTQEEIKSIYNLNKPFYDGNPKIIVPDPSSATITFV